MPIRRTWLDSPAQHAVLGQSFGGEWLGLQNLLRLAHGLPLWDSAGQWAAAELAELDRLGPGGRRARAVELERVLAAAEARNGQTLALLSGS